MSIWDNNPPAPLRKHKGNPKRTFSCMPKLTAELYLQSAKNPCMLSSEDLKYIFRNLKEEKLNCNGTIITGDLNFHSTDCRQFTSNDKLHEAVLSVLIENSSKVIEGINKQLDVVLTNIKDTIHHSVRHA